MRAISGSSRPTTAQRAHAYALLTRRGIADEEAMWLVDQMVEILCVPRTVDTVEDWADRFNDCERAAA